MEIDRDKIEVSNDCDFLQLLMDKHNINAKQLAGWIGRAPTTIYKYLSGENTIPSVIWRAIFERTHDIAVFNIVRGDLPCVIAPLIQVMIPPDAASLQQLLNMRRKQLKCEEYIVQILSDGKIDSSDIAAIANYKLAFPDMVSSQAQIYQAILTETVKAGVHK